MTTLIQSAQVFAYMLLAAFSITLLAILLQAVKLTKAYKCTQNYIASVSMYVIELFNNITNINTL